MKKLHLKYLLIIPLVFNGVLFSQNDKYEKELPLLKTKNQQLDSLINDAVFHLKKCDYYSKAIVFSIGVVEKKDSIFIELTANYDLKTTLILEQYLNLYGYFFYNEHLFVVFLKNSKSDFFELTEQKEKFIVRDYMAPIADYPSWLYLYKENKFMLQTAIFQCRDKN